MPIGVPDSSADRRADQSAVLAHVGQDQDFRRVVVGESRTFQGGIEWLRSFGVEVIDLDSQECVDLLTAYIQKNPAVWSEDIGEE